MQQLQCLCFGEFITLQYLELLSEDGLLTAEASQLLSPYKTSSGAFQRRKFILCPAVSSLFPSDSEANQLQVNERVLEARTLLQFIIS